MRHIDESLRLHHDVDLSSRPIVQSVAVSATAAKTVAKRRAPRRRPLVTA